MRALFVGAVVVGLMSCSDRRPKPKPKPNPPTEVGCPSSLEFPADYFGPTPRQARVGGAVTFTFVARVPAECAQVLVEQPSGSFVVDKANSVSVTLDEPGWYSATLSLGDSEGGLTASESVLAIAEPVSNVPCLSLDRHCLRVSRTSDFVACDETLFQLDGGLVATLDGGEWFAADDTLFAWADGELRLIDTDGGIVASTPWNEKPQLWSADRQQLAVWNGDAGARFDVENGLAMIGEVTSSDALVASAVQSDGGLLRMAEVPSRVACPLEGVCATAPQTLLGMSVDAANARSVWVSTFHFYPTGYVGRLDQEADGGWSLNHRPLQSFVGEPGVNRRGFVWTAWGARYDEQTSSDMRFDGAGSGGASDDVVWLTDGVTTRVWCE